MHGLRNYCSQASYALAVVRCFYMICFFDPYRSHIPNITASSGREVVNRFPFTYYLAAHLLPLDPQTSVSVSSSFSLPWSHM